MTACLSVLFGGGVAASKPASSARRLRGVSYLLAQLLVSLDVKPLPEMDYGWSSGISASFCMPTLHTGSHSRWSAQNRQKREASVV